MKNKILVLCLHNLKHSSFPTRYSKKRIKWKQMYPVIVRSSWFQLFREHTIRDKWLSRIQTISQCCARETINHTAESRIHSTQRRQTCHERLLITISECIQHKIALECVHQFPNKRTSDTVHNRCYVSRSSTQKFSIVCPNFSFNTLFSIRVATATAHFIFIMQNSSLTRRDDIL